LTSWSSSEVPFCKQTVLYRLLMFSYPTLTAHRCKYTYLTFLGSSSNWLEQFTSHYMIKEFLCFLHTHMKLNTLCTAVGNKKKICSFINTTKIVKRSKEQNYTTINTCKCRISIKVTSTLQYNFINFKKIHYCISIHEHENHLKLMTIRVWVCQYKVCM
jgi:hypothetical protein